MEHRFSYLPLVLPHPSAPCAVSVRQTGAHDSGTAKPGRLATQPTDAGGDSQPIEQWALGRAYACCTSRLKIEFKQALQEVLNCCLAVRHIGICNAYRRTLMDQLITQTVVVTSLIQ